MVNFFSGDSLFFLFVLFRNRYFKLNRIWGIKVVFFVTNLASVVPFLIVYLVT